MAKKLYVGNLSYGSTEDMLRDAFTQCGEVVSVQVIMDKMTGKSKGFGFVEMSTDEQADAAIRTWDGQMLDGREIRVNEARPLDPNGPPRRDRGTGGRY